MKKVLYGFTAAVVSLSIMAFSEITVYASEEEEQQDITEVVEEYQDKIKAIIGEMDESAIEEAFSFLKEKAEDGALQTEEGIREAVEEGKEKFGVEVEEQYIEEMLDLVNELEEIGFDSEKLISNAESMYQEYGVDFVNHAQELVTETVKDSIGTIIINAIAAFFRIIGEVIADFFTDLF
jgi:uncharacterized protein YpuA (DUF1002 family)